MHQQCGVTRVALNHAIICQNQWIDTYHCNVHCTLFAVHMYAVGLHFWITILSLK